VLVEQRHVRIAKKVDRLIHLGNVDDAALGAEPHRETCPVGSMSGVLEHGRRQVDLID
jgi:hypothetical protein